MCDSVSNISQQIFYFFSNQADDLGRSSGFRQRRSKLTPSGFIKGLIATCFSQCFGLEVFCSFLREQGIIITKQGLSERFNSRTLLFLKEISGCFLKQFQTEKLPQLKGLEQFSGIKIIDSSTVSLHSLLAQFFKGSGGNASSAALKIQLMFDYLSGQVKELTLTPGCNKDQGFNTYFNSIQQGALYLMDLGYFKLSSFKKIMDGKAFFVSRLLTGTKLYTTDGKPLELLNTLLKAPTAYAQNVLLGATSKIPVRLIAHRLAKEIADRRRAKLKKGHKRRGKMPSKESLALQDWSIYLTNTTQSQISNQDIHQTYALRWQIELLFKLSKSLMNIQHINSKNPARVAIETYGKFISIMLLFLLSAPVRNQQNQQMSFFKACKLLIIRAYDLIHVFASIYRLKKFINAFFYNPQLFAIKDLKKTQSPFIIPSDGDNF